MNCIFGLILLFINLSYYGLSYSNAYDINGFCGFPGKPVNSKVEPQKQYYSNGDTVTYQCDDYWFYIQTRKCHNGQWIGNAPRCGIAVGDNDLAYVKVEDITTIPSQIKFEYNLTLGPKKAFPSSFTSRRFRIPLEVNGTGRFRWTLKLQNSTVLPFIRIGFAYVNQTIDESMSSKFDISANVSSHRTCIMEHQFRGSKWRRNGTKIDNYFICDALSQNDYNLDAENPGNYIIVETQVSVNITYQLLALFLADAYGTHEKPLCGHPEYSYGQTVNKVGVNRDYSVQCNENMKYVSRENPDLPDTPIHKQQCIYNMKWNGSYPKCVPQQYCQMLDIENDVRGAKILSLNNVYYFNDTQWYAIEGSTVKFGCPDQYHEVLLGDAVHHCINGQWIGVKPQCVDVIALRRENRSIK